MVARTCTLVAPPTPSAPGDPAGVARRGRDPIGEVLTYTVIGMTDERLVRISAEQAEWLRIAAKRMAFDESLLAATAVIAEIADAYETAPRTRLGALFARPERLEPVPVEPIPEPAPFTRSALSSPAGSDDSRSAG